MKLGPRGKRYFGIEAVRKRPDILNADPGLSDPAAFFKSGIESVYNRMIRQDPCVYCGDTKTSNKKNGTVAKRTIDHIRPKSSGHGLYWMNKAPCCERCNYLKGSKSVLEHLLDRCAKVCP